MSRSIAIVGAPTSIGIRTYDSGEPRQLDRAPGVLPQVWSCATLECQRPGRCHSPPRIETTYAHLAACGTKPKAGPIA
jgi:hypothetical protein